MKSLSARNFLLKSAALLLGCFALWAAGGCDNEIKVNAPKKDIIVIYGVLNPQSLEQVIRVSKAYLTEGDAIQYAADNDITLKDAKVTLSFVNRNNERITVALTPKDTVRKDGSFSRKMTVYTTRARIFEGFRYELKVEGSLETGGTPITATAYTYVPERPTFIRPDNVRLIGNLDNLPTEQNIEAYPRAGFSDPNYTMRFTRGAATGSRKVYGRAFEYRIFHTYSPAGSPQQITAQFGPSNAFAESNTSCPPNVGSDVICYRIGKEFLNYMRSTVDLSRAYTYEDGFKSQSTRIEMTAIDTFLYNYMRVNSPAFTDFTTVKPEYTNINGGLGIFGAINTAQAFVRLDECTRYLLRLNNQAPPAGCE